MLLKALTGLSGPTAKPQKNEQCSPAARMQFFRSESKIKKATYLSRKESFCQVRILICQVGTFICQEEEILSKKGDLFSHVYGA